MRYSCLLEMMPDSKLEALKNLVDQNPKNTFARYGLAMEYAKAGDMEQAVEQYRALLSFDPGYCYAYFHCGQALEKLGRTEEAREIYTRGTEAAAGKGDSHARDELQTALDLLS